jgi:two-component system alkaline phosphatase synthesis response regulator PhoP
VQVIRSNLTTPAFYKMTTSIPAAKILFADDEPDILQFMEFNLQREGYKVLLARNGQEAVAIARKEIPDLIILDIMMPKMDGIEACQAMRGIPALNNSVIAMLTARHEEYSQIAGFDAGADDYITKPIRPQMLLARIKALLRRKQSYAAATPVRVGTLEIDREKYMVFRDGKAISFPRKEFELLSLLISSPGRVFDRQEILAAIWGKDVVVDDRTIDVHIRKIREKIGPERIRTIKGIGYKFAGEGDGDGAVK